MGGASDEWEVMHLTESGWVQSGYRHDFGEQQDDIIPAGTVLSVRCHVTVGVLGSSSSVNADETETKQINDEDKINRLLRKYGKPSFGV